MDPSPLIAEWKRRLKLLADNPAYVFRNTPRKLIDLHYQRLTTFAGYSDAEVAQAQHRLGVRFPVVFRAFLLEMARNPGDLFRGSELAGIAMFEAFRADALALMMETSSTLTLPSEAVIFLSHQGYTFTYIMAMGGVDGPPLQWTEGEKLPREVASTFADMVNADLELIEENNRIARGNGGYYLTLRADGTWKETRP